MSIALRHDLPRGVRDAAVRRSRANLRVALVAVVVGLLPVSAWVGWNLSRTEDVLAMQVRPYPSMEPVAVPAPGGGDLGAAGSDRAWVFRTADAPEAVVAYYRNQKVRRAWELLEASPRAIHMRRLDERLVIGLEAIPGGGTTLTYRLQRLAP